MSWEKLKVSAGKTQAAVSAVSASSNGSGGRYRHWLAFRLRQEFFKMDWLRAGARVDVAIGRGEHAGALRILSGSDFVLLNSTGRNKDPNKAVVVLRLPAMAGQSAAKFKARALSFEVAGGGIVIHISELLTRGSPAEAQPSASGAPFKMSAPSHAAVLTDRQQALRR